MGVRYRDSRCGEAYDAAAALNLAADPPLVGQSFDLELSATVRDNFLLNTTRYRQDVTSVPDHTSDYLHCCNWHRCIRSFCAEAGQGCQ